MRMAGSRRRWSGWKDVSPPLSATANIINYRVSSSTAVAAAVEINIQLWMAPNLSLHKFYDPSENPRRRWWWWWGVEGPVDLKPSPRTRNSLLQINKTQYKNNLYRWLNHFHGGWVDGGVAGKSRPPLPPLLSSDFDHPHFTARA